MVIITFQVHSKSTSDLHLHQGRYELVIDTIRVTYEHAIQIAVSREKIRTEHYRDPYNTIEKVDFGFRKLQLYVINQYFE